MPSLIDNIFLNTIENNPISGKLTSKITDRMPNFVICQKFDKNIMYVCMYVCMYVFLCYQYKITIVSYKNKNVKNNSFNISHKQL